MKNNKLNKYEKEERIVGTIQILTDSFLSHLPYAVSRGRRCATCGQPKFHKEAMLDYWQAIKNQLDIL